MTGSILDRSDNSCTPSRRQCDGTGGYEPNAPLLPSLVLTGFLQALDAGAEQISRR